MGWLVGATVASGWLGLCWFLGWDTSPLYAVGAVLLGVVAGGGYGLRRPLRQQIVAQWVDQQVGFQERLTTASWLAESGDASSLSPFALLQLQDAHRYATDLSQKRIARIRLPRTLWAAIAMSAIALFLWFAPDLTWLQSPQVRQQKQAMRVAGERLERLAEEWRKQTPSQQDEQMRRLTQQMQTLSKQMQRARLSQREAMLQMSRLQRQAEQQQRQLTQASVPKSMQRASDQFLSARAVQEQLLQAKREKEASPRIQPAAYRQDLPFAQQVTQQMALALSQQDVSRLSQVLQQIAQRWNELSREEQLQIEKTLRELAKSLKDTELDAAAKEIQRALEHLRQGDQQEAARCLQGACRACEAAASRKREAERWARIAANLAMLKSEMAIPSAQVGANTKSPSAGIGAASSRIASDRLEYRPQRSSDTSQLLPPEGPVQRVRGIPRLTPQDQPLAVTRGAPDIAPSIVPDARVYLRYQQAAERAIQREWIPPEYRQPVRQYFEALRPQ